jgi:predicted DNA-binding transcriptional regulator YafY
MNGSVYYSIDKLHAALGQGVGVTFHYFEYNVKKKRVFRRNGRRYAVIPYGLIWDNENYYLVGWDLYRREVRHYRVDKMVDMNICKLPEACPEERGRFDVAAYTAKHFNMFSGREGNLRLRCKNTLAGVILDRFGQDSILVPDGDAFFTVMVDAVVSAQFWGWLFGLGADITVTGPDWAVNDYRRQLAEVAAAYSR